MKKKYLIELLLEQSFECDDDERKLSDIVADIECAVADKLFDCPGNLQIVNTWVEEEVEVGI